MSPSKVLGLVEEGGDPLHRAPVVGEHQRRTVAPDLLPEKAVDRRPDGLLRQCPELFDGADDAQVEILAPTCVDTPMIYNPATFKLFCPEIENPTAADFEARVADMFGPAHFPAEEVSRALLYFVLDERGVYQGNTMDIQYGMLTRNAV